MAYTGNLPKGLDTSEPAIGTAKVNELDDAIRQIKRAMLAGSFTTATASGNYVVPDDTANVIYNGAGGHTLTLPEISDVAATVNSIPVEHIVKIFNEGTTTGSGGAITVDAHTGDTLARLVTLWQHESAILVSNASTDEWSVIIDSHVQLAASTTAEIEAAKFFTAQSDVTSSRAIGTTYQNTGTKTKFITIAFHAATPNENFLVYCDSNATPTTLVGYVTPPSASESVSFMVLPNYYYKATKTGNGYIESWVEWS